MVIFSEIFVLIFNTDLELENVIEAGFNEQIRRINNVSFEFIQDDWLC